MLNFYPGPSKVYPEVRQFLTDAYDGGIMNIPHRSETFMQLMRATVNSLKKKLNIPQDYYIFFTSSATECWEIIAQSFTLSQSFHLYNGSFGQKWFEYAQKICSESQAHEFPLEEHIDTNNLEIPDDAEVVCITQNETSNGTQINANTILNLYNKCKDQLLAVDATSSMAGLNLKYIKADIWFASVQKCFGLPPGMAVMVCSPRALYRAKKLDEKNHYNSVVLLYEKMLNYQTSYTPNTLNLYLMNRVLEQRELIKTIDQQLVQRAQNLYEFFEPFTQFRPLVTNPEVRSNTVIALQGHHKLVEDIKKNAAAHNIQLGNGYGKWARDTFRIANFPANTDVEFETLKDFFTKNYN
ncbi:aminotransferase class V-fold PLP-dependent enzyme [Adhaeribacter sp. BT258]|uniref:phosphoserine transaminase n=1 Tax=Adhaeribacter terrigena TaxID=2793070 RepID=A0ABS1BYY1_9BACT|nr:aminotransferase class V-fold PLP-dependent enzyme [Adhaeribacter terrigena]